MSTSSSAVRARARPVPADFPYYEVAAAGSSNHETGPGQPERLDREAAARAAGIAEGLAQARMAHEAELSECRRATVAAIEEFAADRRKYFLSVEPQVVKLAINIARKILRRESNIDPLLLAGMVRAALEPLAQATSITVRVHPMQLSNFRSLFAEHMGDHIPEVIADDSLSADRCILQTNLGSTEIGPEVQLQEIERGLVDLQSAKP